MLHLLQTSTPAIGLDIGSESIKLIQLGILPGGELAVRAALRTPIPDDVKGDPDKRVTFAGKTVAAALRQGIFRGRRVVAALPKELVHYKTHRLPSMSADELHMAAKIDARDLFRFDPDSADVQVIDAGEIRQGEDRRREVILVAAGKQYIDQVVVALDRSGARVASLEIDPCAVWRAARRVEPEPDGSTAQHPRVILDVGAAQSRLLIGRGETIRVVRTIDVGGGTLRTAISRKLGLPLAEVEQLRRRVSAESESGGAKKLDTMRQVLGDATRYAAELLAREVLMCVRYHAVTFRGPAARRIELVGGEANDPQIRSTLAAALLLPVKPADLFHGIDTVAIPADQRTGSLGQWAVALGLALKGMPERARPPVPATEIGAAGRIEQPILDVAPAPVAALAGGVA